MTSRPVLAAVTLATLAWCACRSEPQPPENAAPAQSGAPAAEALFDGSTLAGWDGDPRFWRVEGGCLVGESTAANPCEATTYLLWRGGALGDFELSFEYRITGGNSGLQFRSEDRGGWQVAGFQADIEDGPNWTGCLYEQDGAGVVATRGEEVLLEAAGPRKARFASAEELLARVKPRDWNRYVVRARGERVELEVNGALTASVVDLRPERRLAGLLALQLHAGPPMKVEYRELELVRLGASVPAPVPAPAASSDGAPPKSVFRPQFEGAKPQWLWASAQAPDGDTVALTRRFVLPQAAQRALLRGAADNHLRAFVNGRLALANDTWETAYEADVTGLLREGDNELTVLARNDGGPAGAWLELLVERDGARPMRVLSDASWLAQRPSTAPDFASWTPESLDAARYSPAHVLGAFGMSPWGGGGANPAPEPDQRALAAEELQLLPGFRAELLYSVPKSQQGSWVALCEDPKGRLYTSDQYGGLYRVSVGASADETRVERVQVDLGSAHGLCWAYDSLYVVVSESSGKDNGLYRVRDTDGDDALDLAVLLRKFESGGEHGPHAVVLGPDGQLWIVGGNHTPLPEPIDVYARPKNWAEDMLLPRIEDPNGHAVGIRAPAGWVVRTDPDGKRWELWACGFRNSYDIAFDSGGELFTFDSDMEWDMGAPWYRPTRIFHVVRGADFGWRGGPGKMPPQYPDTLPSVVDIGASSPTGVTFGYGAKFPPRYERALYALDWAYGTIYAVHLEPRGSSFGGTFEKFATGKPFAVTDVVIGRDGAMYVTTGGRRTQSGLYRISADAAAEPGLDGALALDDAYAATRSERARRNAVAKGMTSAARDNAELVALLDDADRFLAVAARTTLEQRPEQSWAASEPLTPSGLVHSCVALAHAGSAEARDALVPRLAKLDLKALDEDGRIAALRAHQLALLRYPELDATVRDSFRARCEPLYPSGAALVDRELLQLLVALESPRALEPAIALLESDAAQEEKIWAAYCLRCAKAGWTPELRERFFKALASLRESAKGGYSLTKYIDEIRRQSAAALSEEERAAVAAWLELPKPAVTAPVVSATFVRSWTRADLAGFVSEPLAGRQFERGKAAFSKARCVECHRIGGEGGATGPDLTGAGSRFSRSDWLDNLLEPSKVISDQYQDTEVLTTDGDLYVGRIERDDAAGLALRRLPPQEDLLELSHDQIERRRLYPFSRMPSGLLDVLDEDEIRDLAAYVLSGANPASPEFQR